MARLHLASPVQRKLLIACTDYYLDKEREKPDGRGIGSDLIGLLSDALVATQESAGPVEFHCLVVAHLTYAVEVFSDSVADESPELVRQLRGAMGLTPA